MKVEVRVKFMRMLSSIYMAQKITSNELCSCLLRRVVISGAAWPAPFGDLIAAAGRAYKYAASSVKSPHSRKSNRLASLHLIASNDDVNPPNMAERLLGGVNYFHDGKHEFPLNYEAIRLTPDFISKS